MSNDMLTVKIMLIYIIKNTKNDKVYIGQTVLNLEFKWKNYYKEYKYKKNIGLRLIIRAMRKHGFDKFYIETLKDNIESQEELDYWERYYIKEYDSTNNLKGYNIELGGNGHGKHSKKTLERMSKAQLGSKNHMFGKKGKENPTSKRIIDLTTGICYDSASEACEKLGYKTKVLGKICACARGDRWFTKHRTFRYLDEEGKPIIVNLPKSRGVFPKYICKNDGKEFFLLSDLISYYNIPNKSSVFSIVSGKKKSHNGLVFIKTDELYEIEYYTKGRDFNKILPEYVYLINTVLSPTKVIGKV